MMSEAKKEWIRKHKIRGDIKLAVENLNRKGCTVTYGEAGSVICSDLWGKHGRAVWMEMERIIRRREKQIKKETELYAECAA
jgi:hypothetical protein